MQLEEIHGWDLSEKKDLIKEVFNAFVDRRMAEYAANNNDEVEEDDASVRSDDGAPRGKTRSMCMNDLQ